MYADGGSITVSNPSAGQLPELARRWRGRRVVVVGDALLDRWLVGSPRKLCREAPVPVIGLGERSEACGGAANTAANLAGLGAHAVLVSAVGPDEAGDRLRERATAAGVEVRLVEVSGRRTVVKSRLVADEQILVRFDDGDRGALPEWAVDDLSATLESALDKAADALVVCDYEAGVLGERIRRLLAARRDRLPMTVVDAHTPLAWAAVRPDLVTPSYAEARRSLEPGAEPDTADAEPDAADRAGWVTRQGAALRDRLCAETVVVTLDTDGAVVLDQSATPYRTYAQPAPARRASGAGDSYVAGFTLALLAGADSPLAAEVAQLAATAATRVPGTAVCDLAGLGAAGEAAEQRVVNAGGLARRIAEHRKHGRRVVFTNGCFDVLHRGHVGYLNQAKRLGDVLVVAVNSDESVRRLKGPDRPVNPAADRVAVLAALSCVDHVVVFDEDSPTALIELARPDVYVKGGDYRPDLIPEAPLVRRLGGEVRVLDYLYDRSTTRLIERIRTGAGV
jgi:rfaE bifunctional protein nucleotidyltransferase chain/domain/rfaE bifunctional protein kinase chain/domain